MKPQDVAIRSGLSAAAALAASSGAYGAIVTPGTLPANITIPAGTNVTATGVVWDVDGDATGDFQFRYRSNMNPTNGWAFSAQMLMNAGAAVKSTGGGYGPYASLLLSGTVIDATGMLSATRAILGSAYAGVPYGGFGAAVGSVRGFVGFQFLDLLSAVHFGWIELEVFAEGNGNPDGTGAGGPGIKFYGAAYESTPNTPIQAGAIPAPSALGALALGAAGLIRRKRVA